ncbi:hypothetical protein Taro_015515, partial [Colocasia esculenta]|nr:hypothetical protein [Colocasia esculenta]
ARASRRSYAEEDERRRGLGTSWSHLSYVGYFFNPRIQYKDNVHNDGEVMGGTMNVITRLARIMNERLEAMAEVLEPQEVMGLGVSFQDMRIIQYYPINNKEAKGKHNNNLGDMKVNKGKQGMIGDMGLLIHPFLFLPWFVMAGRIGPIPLNRSGSGAGGVVIRMDPPPGRESSGSDAIRSDSRIRHDPIPDSPDASRFI